LGSNFVFHTSCNTTSNLTPPFYAKINFTKSLSGGKILGIKTSQSITFLFFKNTELEEPKKLVVEDETLNKQTISTFIFKNETYSSTSPPTLLIGYKSGIIAHIDCFDEKVLGIYNYEEKTKNINKPVSVSHLITLPDSNNKEVLALFEDSTMMKYSVNTQSQNTFFNEKLKKFEAKINFDKALNKFKHKTKTKNNIRYSSYITELKPEFSHFYAYTQDSTIQNPLAYYKFNHRTISDIVVKKHSIFTKIAPRDFSDNQISVLAFTSLDGYLVLFELSKMKPILSYKARFGGINSLSFSENCELVALSGQDDCITVINLLSLTAICCEGHRSFVSRAIFQTIPTSGQENHANFKSDYIRVVGAGLDGKISFWDLYKNDFQGNKTSSLPESMQPLQLSASTMSMTKMSSPAHLEQIKDAVGSIEICENILAQCSYDGLIATYVIKDLTENDIIKPPIAESDANQNLYLSSAKPPETHNETEKEQEEEKEENPSFQKQDSNVDYKFEQREYENENSTVSHAMEHFEETTGKFKKVSPSRPFAHLKSSNPKP